MSDNMSGFPQILYTLIRRLNLLNRDQKVCYGMTMSQCLTIETLSLHPCLKMKDLSTEMGLSISTMTRIVDILVRDNILKRRKKAEDRRQVCIELTSKGHTLSKKLLECSSQYANKLFLAIPPRKREMVKEALSILSEAAGTADTATCCSA
jgi:DNA-binding MarR family transcriptional regulator